MFERQKDKLFVKWAKLIKQRDNYQCKICGKTAHLHSHHLNAWASYEDQRYLLENGVTLCQWHHELFHHIYGKGKNTKTQFDQFAKVILIIENNLRSAIKKT